MKLRKFTVKSTRKGMVFFIGCLLNLACKFKRFIKQCQIFRANVINNLLNVCPAVVCAYCVNTMVCPSGINLVEEKLEKGRRSKEVCERVVSPE